MKCDRCYKSIRKPDKHGWMRCEYMPRINPHEPVPGKWTRHTDVERNVYAADLLQPVRKDGKINEKFIKAHGTKELQKQWKMSEKEIRENAK